MINKLASLIAAHIPSMINKLTPPIAAHNTSTHSPSHMVSPPPILFQPTIVIDASLSVDIHMFLLNFGTICNTAFFGTTISCWVIACLQWVWGYHLGIAYSMPLLHNLVCFCVYVYV